MKKRFMMLSLGVVGCFVFLNGCAPAVQIGASLIGEAIGKGMESKQEKNPWLRYDFIINKHAVEVFQVPNKDKHAMILFNDSKTEFKADYCFKNDEYVDFLNMNLVDKKRYIRDVFLKFKNIDIGVIGNES